MLGEIWEELKKKGELGRCKKCGKLIWSYWHTKRAWDIKHPLMKKCGPCFFNRSKNG